MNSNKLGCLSPLAIFTAILTLAIILVWELLSGNLMFTAGALNAQPGQLLGGTTSHYEFGRECEKCHVAPWSDETMADRCVACHIDIQAELQNPGELHGAILAENPSEPCRACHHEHRGQNAALIDVNPALFPHDVLEFSLNAHAETDAGIPFTCNDCHTPDYEAFEVNLCADCHKQRDMVLITSHMLDFGGDCLACHDGKESLGKNFDHNKVQFALTGKHSDVICSKCHLGARKLADLQSAPVICEACHVQDDPHANRFGSVCADCHNTEGWQVDVKFNHNLANFILEGEHINVTCEQCHTTPHQFAGTPSDCYSCHEQDDEHNGDYGTDCAVCHNPTDWNNADFDHNLFEFKLEGAHADVKCLDCHVNSVFKDTPGDCYSCHKQDDHHEGRFGESCSLCHSTSQWNPSTFNHNLSKFPLTGRHTSVSCERCHPAARFQGSPITCIGCHGEPAYHAGMFSSNCAQCHNTNNWYARYTGPHPGISDDDGGSGVRHGGEGCRSCHTQTLSKATCTKCHDSNDGGDDDD